MCLKLISSRTEAFFSPVQIYKSRVQAQAKMALGWDMWEPLQGQEALQVLQ